MGKLPAFQFYPGDWMKDPQLRAVGYEARGLWIDMLCLMHENDRRGYLQLNGKPVSHSQLARMTGGESEQVSRLLQELESSGVLSRTEHGVVYSRRMVRDEAKRVKCTEAGRRGGNPTLKGGAKGGSKGRPKGEPTPSSSTSPSGQDREREGAGACEAGDGPTLVGTHPSDAPRRPYEAAQRAAAGEVAPFDRCPVVARLDAWAASKPPSGRGHGFAAHERGDVMNAVREFKSAAPYAGDWTSGVIEAINALVGDGKRFGDAIGYARKVVLTELAAWASTGKRPAERREIARGEAARAAAPAPSTENADRGLADGLARLEAKRQRRASA